MRHDCLQMVLEVTDHFGCAAMQYSGGDRPSLLSPSKSTTPTVGGSHADDELLQSLLLAEGGESASSLQQKNREFESARVELSNIITAKSAQIHPIQAEIERCCHQVDQLSQRKHALETELKAVNESLQGATAKRDSLKAHLDDTVKHHKGQYEHLEHLTTNMAKSVKLEMTSKQMVDSVKRLEHSFGSTILGVADLSQRCLSALNESSSSSPSKSKGTIEKAAMYTAQFNARKASCIVAFNEYAVTECKCVDILADRVLTARRKADLLKRELDEYNALGMLNMAAEVSKLLSKSDSNISEDLSALNIIANSLNDAALRMATTMGLEPTSEGAYVCLSVSLHWWY